MRGVVIGCIERLQDPETGKTDFPHFVIQHPANVLQIVISKELHTIEGKGDMKISGRYLYYYFCGFGVTSTHENLPILH